MSTTTSSTTAPPPTALGRAAGGAGKYLDDRLGVASQSKKLLRKVFPDHWSFMLGEVALYSFIILLISGTFLTFWYVPSVAEVTYEGSYVPLKGVHMSEAYASTLEISFDVRGGLVMRQIHHWAALLFVASMMVHLLRVFFTGAFRKPREFNWVIGAILLILGIVEGFAGYSLPDDLLSGTGLRIAQAIIQAIPVVGTWLSFFVFGGEFPGTAFIPRLYTIHVLLLPAIFLALITAHLALVFFHKHTQYPGPGRTEKNVVGYPLMPVYIAKAGGFFFLVFGVMALLAAIATINPIWGYGPYEPTQVTAGSQPDWYMGFLDGAVRSMPNWETTVFGVTISWNIIVPAMVLPGILFTLMIFYPFIEAWVTGDRREHHILDRPRNQPTRTALGVMSLVFFAILFANGGNDILAITFNVSINAITWATRILLFVAPPIAFVITKRICLGLQRRDREKVLHGRETGIIQRLPNGEFVEVHEPVTPAEAWVLTQQEVQRPLELGPATDENGVRRPGSLHHRLRARVSRFYFGDRVEPPTPDEVRELEASHGGH
ncbi:cytochrome b [Vallicoccus soli]|uniref:Cytochrome bc1 complex cytochrome b subunit n=1 Tax=Vallicoccus soli TaxID=2339232 RepID=A0A3A3Z7T0_9ACTN|nr:ubiquinol-cytochrome c reductase cytochrome b subunit [Vallicoccus soli]RJK96897.1 ubiquinol-cytochrome c reductase cytochrome b subunit [Vallicoccus soli]